MMDIATLTLNPAVDIAYTVPDLVPVDKLRAAEQRCDPGGGGINVARVFVRLGGNARCLYLSGGPTGTALDALVDQHKLVRERIAIRGETRISATICEERTGHEFRVVPAGPQVAEEEWRACLDRIGTLTCDYLVMSGSLPRGVPADFYAQAARIARRQGIRPVLDTSGEALAEGLAGHDIELVKPNLKELESLAGERLGDTEAIAEAACAIARAGKARLVAVSMADKGGLLASMSGVVGCVPPPVETASAVGAGDSFVAAMVHALAAGRSEVDAFRFGIAGGTAALLTPGTGLARSADIDRLFGQLACDD